MFSHELTELDREALLDWATGAITFDLKEGFVYRVPASDGSFDFDALRRELEVYVRTGRELLTDGLLSAACYLLDIDANDGRIGLSNKGVYGYC